MGHARRQETDRRQLLVLEQHGADAIALGQVADRRQELHRAAAAQADDAERHLQGQRGAVFAQARHLDRAARAGGLLRFQVVVETLPAVVGN